MSNISREEAGPSIHSEKLSLEEQWKEILAVQMEQAFLHLLVLHKDVKNKKYFMSLVQSIHLIYEGSLFLELFLLADCAKETEHYLNSVYTGNLSVSKVLLSRIQEQVYLMKEIKENYFRKKM